MSRLGITTLLLVLAISLCVFEFFKVNSISEKMIDDLTSIKQLVSDENIVDATELCHNTYDFWQSNTLLLSIFIQHDNIENIEQTLALMNSAVEKNEIGDFWAENQRAIIQISNLSDTEYPNIENIL